MKTIMTENITSFQQRLAENLANVSASPGDEFKLLGYSHNYSEFDCDLCGHRHCVREFIIENIETSIEMSIGSECINHFKNKGIDINLAEGLMKRIERATATSRKGAVNALGLEIWEALSLEDKKEIYPYFKEGSQYVPYISIEKMGKEAFKELNKSEKDERTVNAYMIYQAKELLTKVTWYDKNAILTEEQIQDILNLGLEKELNRYNEIKSKRK